MQSITDDTHADSTPVYTGPELVESALRENVWHHIVRDPVSGRVGLAPAGDPGGGRSGLDRTDVIATLPPVGPRSLGDPTFRTTHGADFCYAGGEMARAIASTNMVVALADAGMVGFYGAGGLDGHRVAAAIDDMRTRLAGRRNWGVNLIHAPHDPRRESTIAGLLITRDVPIVSLSNYMAVTANVVRCSASGLTTDRGGETVRRRRIFAKVSRPEVAEQFLSPAPPEILDRLVRDGVLSRLEADLAATIPVAEDVTVEADSGGHTDGRPLGVILPAVIDIRTAVVARHRYRETVRVGAAGGLGTPIALVSAFAAGADYVVTGSINQATTESGLADEGKRLLGDADVADVTMAPTSDMFALGVKLQVLQRGTMFANRANLLYDLYRQFDSLEAIPERHRTRIERDVFRDSIDAAWSSTVEYWRRQDPAELDRADREPKHRMALLFRSYLGQSSRWPVTGDPDRRHDYQIWCGPAMGAFNRWAGDGFLGDVDTRSVVQIARNLMTGAAVLTRLNMMRTCGVPLPASAFTYAARRLE